MAAKSSPLPFFNSISKRGLCVMATQKEESRKIPLEFSSSIVHLNITFTDIICSDNPWRHEFLEGITMIGTETIVSSIIDSPTECREVIRSVLTGMIVPLELRDCTWRHKFLGSEEEIHEMPKVEDVDGLIENICWFLYNVKTQIHNKDFSFLPVNLAIMKKIVISDDNFGHSALFLRDRVRDMACITEDGFPFLNHQPTATETTIEGFKHLRIEN